MKLLTYTTLLLLIWIQSGHTFGQTHCIPLDESRQLHEDALKARELEKTANAQAEVIELQQSANNELAQSYATEFRLMSQKFEKQKEITADMVRFSETWQSEAEYYQKRSKKFRRQRNGLGLGIIAVVVLALI